MITDEGSALVPLCAHVFLACINISILFFFSFQDRTKQAFSLKCLSTVSHADESNSRGSQHGGHLDLAVTSAMSVICMVIHRRKVYMQRGELLTLNTSSLSHANTALYVYQH